MTNVRTLPGGTVIGPLTFKCPNCMASPGSPCTQPTNDSRKPVSWFHTGRESAVDTVYYDPEVCHYELRWHVNPHRNCFLR